MDVQTANRIYDETAMTVGMRLIDGGADITEADVAVLATEADRDAGTDRACSIGRLALDTADLAAVRRALDLQRDRIRSIMAMHAPRDTAFEEVQRRDMDEAKLRESLLEAYLENDRARLEVVYIGIMALHARR